MRDMTINAAPLSNPCQILIAAQCELIRIGQVKNWSLNRYKQAHNELLALFEASPTSTLHADLVEAFSLARRAASEAHA